MAGDSNTGFVHGFDLSLEYNFHMLSFQTDVMNSSAEMNSGVMCSSSGNNNAFGSFPSGSPDIFGNSFATFNAGTSFGSGPCEGIRGLKHDSRLAVDWNYEEQNILNEGLTSLSCSLLRQGMKQISISTMDTNLIGQDAKMAMIENILMQITNASLLVKLYCAAAICVMLNNWARMDKVKARENILKC